MPRNKVKTYEGDLSTFVIPIHKLHDLCNCHASTLQRQVHKACEEGVDYVITNPKIGRFTVGQPRMMVTREVAAELVAARRQWNKAKATQELETFMEENREEQAS